MTDSQPLTLDVLKQALTGSAAAFRCRNRLQPAGGPGSKVFPPTYADRQQGTWACAELILCQVSS